MTKIKLNTKVIGEPISCIDRKVKCTRYTNISWYLLQNLLKLGHGLPQ